MTIRKNAVVGVGKNAIVGIGKNAVVAKAVYSRVYIGAVREIGVPSSAVISALREFIREGKNHAYLSFTRDHRVNKRGSLQFERDFVQNIRATLLTFERGISNQKSAKIINRHDKYILDDYRIIATDTTTETEIDLGYGASVPIPDGTYTLEVRIDHAFWQNARSNNTFYLEISGDEIVIASNLPTILNLTSFRKLTTVISFSISNYADCNIGLWFNPITPVITSGAPDIILEVNENITDYQYEYSQTSAEYVAVACFTDTDQGASAEHYLPLIPSTVTSPKDQFAQP